MYRYLIVLLCGAAALAQEPPASFVELSPQPSHRLASLRLGGLADGPWELPVLVDGEGGPVVYDWTWRSREPLAVQSLPSLIPTGWGHSLLQYERATAVAWARDAAGHAWVAVVAGHPACVGLFRFRSPYETRPYSVPLEMPYDDPMPAEALRQELHLLARTHLAEAYQDGVALLDEEVVKGLDRFDLAPGEPDFPAPFERRLAAAREVWRLGAAMLNEALPRWQAAPFVTEYGCLYAPQNAVWGGAPWRAIILPPQVRERIARLRDLPEGLTRAALRWEANRLLLDYLVPSVGVASRVASGSVAMDLVTDDPPFLPLGNIDGFGIESGQNQRGEAFDGVSLWYRGRAIVGDLHRGCLLAVRTSGQVVWKLETPLPER